MGVGSMGGAAVDLLLAAGYRVSTWTRRPREVPGARCFHGAEQLREFAGQADVVVSSWPLGLLRLHTFLPAHLPHCLQGHPECRVFQLAASGRQPDQPQPGAARRGCRPAGSVGQRQAGGGCAGRLPSGAPAPRLPPVAPPHDSSRPPRFGNHSFALGGRPDGAATGAGAGRQAAAARGGGRQAAGLLAVVLCMQACIAACAHCSWLCNFHSFETCNRIDKSDRQGSAGHQWVALTGA